MMQQPGHGGMAPPTIPQQYQQQQQQQQQQPQPYMNMMMPPQPQPPPMWAPSAQPPPQSVPPPQPIQPTSADEVRTLWIGDLQYWMDENYLYTCFAHTGEVASVKVIRNKQTSQSEGYGFIEFTSHSAAERILQTYNGTIMPNGGQNFRLNWASFGAGEKRHDDSPDYTIFVGDLAADVTDYHLQEVFRARYPSVKGAKVVIDRLTGRTKGYGFVRFGDESEQVRAMTEMQGALCSTRPMRIGPASNKNPGAQPKASYQNPQGAQNENDPNNTTIFVGNLDPNVTDDHLRQVFGQYSSEDGENQSKGGDRSPKAYDSDTMAFISMSQELKEEGNKLFQKRDLEGAMVKYEKALKLLPSNHIDLSYLRSNMAACYMQMGLSEYPRAIHECNLALEVTPKYSKALLKRARCYEALNRLDLALRDVSTVLKMEPNNIMALEISDKVKSALEEKGLRVNDTEIELPPDYVEPPYALPDKKVVKEKIHKKKSNKEKVKAPNKIVEKQAEEKLEEKKTEDSIVEKKANKSKKKKDKEKIEEKKDDVKEVVEENSNCRSEVIPKKTAKLVFGEDIRWAELPINCTLFHLREVICDRFPNLGAVLVKYRDQEGDLVTITSDEELRWAETGSQGSIRLYIVEANPDQDPFFGKLNAKDGEKAGIDNTSENGYSVKEKEIISSSCIEDWIIQFAQLFKNHVGFESDRYLDFHELGMKLYSEAMEETVTSEEAQGLFDMAGDKFQEMAALALFNWGNVHMSRARKKVYLTEDSSRERMYEQIKSLYEWAQTEYAKAGEKYEAAIKIKSDFYEGFMALGHQQFEQAKLSWYYALSSNVDFATWSSTEVLQLYNNAEINMEKGMLIWEESEEKHLIGTSYPNDIRLHLQKMGLDGLFKNMSSDEAAAEAANTRSQINLLWGTMLYERSIVEFKLGLPVWDGSLDVAVEKFELAGASPTDIAVMLKNHCSNDTAVDGLGFKIDEIVQAWNEMYEAKKWQNGVPSFRLEPLFRRRVSKIYHAFELA